MVGMITRARLYSAWLEDHLRHNRQMALVSGPRQVGKTTACRALGTVYLNWDNHDDRRVLLHGPAAVAERLELDRLRADPPVLVLDELHKFPRWKGLLKGFFDTYEDQVRILVTGSSPLDVFRRGGDSLMGRYFLYRLHPWSVAEGVRTGLPDQPIRPPVPIDPETGRPSGPTVASRNPSCAVTRASPAGGTRCARSRWPARTSGK